MSDSPTESLESDWKGKKGGKNLSWQLTLGIFSLTSNCMCNNGKIQSENIC